jgi:hypothetical protein
VGVEPARPPETSDPPCRDTTVIPFRQPEATEDSLTEVAREGARRMLAQVLIAEADSFVARWNSFLAPLAERKPRS